MILSAALGVLACCLLLTRGPGDGGAALGVLAAGGWSLGLLPVHADPGSTGPQRRSGESAALAQPVPPLE
ncbi:hypothetical protein [Kitasatospora sp. NPDC057223]|uniref:hypothetical protein n=1 Tax=Kitasatospora sp. NPDC057223 TaxID=3346055 RepID=UPI00363BD7E9